MIQADRADYSQAKLDDPIASITNCATGPPHTPEVSFLQSRNFRSTSGAMTETYLAYQKPEQVKAVPADTAPTPLGTSFLEYCSTYAEVHAQKACWA